MQKIVETGLKLDLHIHSSASSKKDGNKVKNNTLDNIPVLIEKDYPKKVFIMIDKHPEVLEQLRVKYFSKVPVGEMNEF